MTIPAGKVGRVGWREGGWEEVLKEVADEELFPTDGSFFILERTERIEFGTKGEAVAKGLLNQLWTHGSLFNADRELNWEKRGKRYLLHLLGEGELPEGWEQKEFGVLSEEISLILFGERKEDDPGWREARIPKWLNYPVDKKPGRVSLLAVPYLREGMVIRMRLKGVKIL